MNGLALSSMNQRIGGVLGALFAGSFIAAWGLGYQYTVICACYLAAATLMLTVRSAGQAAPARSASPCCQNLAGYVQVLRQNHILRSMMFMTAITEMFGFTHQSVLPVFARDVLEVGATGFGVMSAVRQGGGVLALGAARRRDQPQPQGAGGVHNRGGVRAGADGLLSHHQPRLFSWRYWRSSTRAPRLPT